MMHSHSELATGIWHRRDTGGQICGCGRKENDILSPHGNRRHLNIQFDGIIIFQKSGTIFYYNKRNNFLHLVFCLMKIFEFAVVVVGSNIALGHRTREKILLFLMFLILNTTYQTSG